MWDSIYPSTDWVESHIPAVRHCYDNVTLLSVIRDLKQRRRRRQGQSLEKMEFSILSSNVAIVKVSSVRLSMVSKD